MISQDKAAPSSTIASEILVVDDTPANLTLLRQMLSARGYRVRVSRNGELGLKFARTTQPDLILLDIRMPDLDGYTVCKILKTDRRTCDIPIVFLSVLETAEEKVEAFQVGGADYVTKPFQTEEVLVRVEHQLLVRRQRAQLKLEVRDRQRAEAVLQQSQSLLAAVLNSSLDRVSAFRAVRDDDGQIVDFQWLLANEIAARSVGTTVDEIAGQRLLDVLPGYRASGLFDDLANVVETGEVLNREVYCKPDVDSSGHWFQAIAVKFDDGATVTFRDITQRKQMELTLKASNIELQQQANLDGLTQIANRRRFDRYLQATWNACDRQQKSLSLLLTDVDRFKQYNDTYGHQAGDLCLQTIAGTLRRFVQYPQDLVARYGGEEFAVVLPQTEAAGAIRVARRLRNAVRQLSIPLPDTSASTQVTLSLGVSSLIPHASSTPGDLIKAADRALYRAKSEGRDRACWQLVRSHELSS